MVQDTILEKSLGNFLQGTEKLKKGVLEWHQSVSTMSSMVLVLNLANTHRTENPCGFSEVGENKQLLIAIIGSSF